MSTPRHPHLRDVLERAESITADTHALWDDLDDARRAWRPAPGAWSITECLEHLRVTGELYYPNLRAALEASAGRRGDEAEEPFRTTFLGRLFLKVTDPANGRRFKAPKMFQPRAGDPDPRSGELFLAQQEELYAILRDADGLPLHRVKLSSPAARWVRFNLGEALLAMVVHQRRHIEQARRVSEHPGFPRSPW